jgi:multiple sugar transport system permease protein
MVRSPATLGTWVARIAGAIAIFFVMIVILSPFIWAIITSFKGRIDSLEMTFIPYVQFQPTMENWHNELVVVWPETSKALRNSAVIAVGAASLATCLGTLGGYALARFSFRMGNANILGWVMSQRFMPPVATLIPFFVLFQWAGLIDTLFGMVLINTTFVLPFAVLIMRDYFAEFPKEIEEAAFVDGAPFWRYFWRIALPIAAPAIAASAIICFAFAWNEFIFASVLTNRNAQPYTMSIVNSAGVRGINFGYIATRMLLAVALPVLLSLFVQRYIIRGLSMGAVKG